MATIIKSQVQQYIKDRVIVDDNGCWIWQLNIQNNGYGQAHMCSKLYLAHRLSYMGFNGDIPSKHQVDHLCKVRECVNPEHLEAVTPKENVARSDHYSKKLAARTECPQGHEYSVENMYVYIRKTGTTRNCKICMKTRSRDRWVNNKQLAGAF